MLTAWSDKIQSYIVNKFFTKDTTTVILQL